jgi:hypothetical protein
MKSLAQQLGERFVRGVVLHLSERALPLADRIQSVPVQALWQAR